MLRLSKYIQCGLITILPVFGLGGVLTAGAADIRPNNADPVSPALRIVDIMPQPGAGIANSARVHDDASCAVLIETRYGIDFSDPDSIRFWIFDGERGIYQRNLNSPAVRVAEVDTDSSTNESVWAVYDRSLEPKLAPVYPLDAVVRIQVKVEDVYWNEIAIERHEFKIESDDRQAHGFDHLPESRSFNFEDADGLHDAGIEIVSGVLAGARILYDADEPILPAFGSIDEIALAAIGNGQAVGAPLNLMPHTVFNNPVKLYIPFPESTDVTVLDIYYFNGVAWLPACDAGGNLLSGGEGWMVPGSRVNHPDRMPPLIEIEAYHFSAASGVVVGSSTTTDNRHYTTRGSGAAVYAECFIGSAATPGTSVEWMPLWLIILVLAGMKKTTKRILYF